MPETIAKFQKTLSKTKLRVFSQGDVILLKCIAAHPDSNASSLMLCVTMAQNKMLSLSQLSPILKTLVKQGLLSSKTTASENTGRPMEIYQLTKRGQNVLDALEVIVDTLGRKA